MRRIFRVSNRMEYESFENLAQPFKQKAVNRSFFIVTVLLLYCTAGFSQVYDADSVFAHDEAAIDFFQSFDTQELENLPSWDNSVIYKNPGWIDLTLDIYYARSEKAPHPCIIFFHGGGWETRALNQYRQYAWYLAGKGYTTAIAKYRVFQDSSVVTVSDEISDAKSAIRYLRKHSEELDIDPEKIVATGMSAGGHLAAATAFINGYEGEDEDLTVSSHPNAIILQNAVIDLSSEGWVDGHELLGEEWELFSPLHHIDMICHSIPSLLLSGSADRLAPVGSMIRWDSLYHATGCFNVFYEFTGRGHGFGNYAESRSGPGHRDFIYCLFFMQKFLEEIGFSPSAAMGTSKMRRTGNDIRIFPVPAPGFLLVQSAHMMQQISVFSILGQIEAMEEVNGCSKTMNLNFSCPGIKILKIRFLDGKEESAYFIKN